MTKRHFEPLGGLIGKPLLMRFLITFLCIAIAPSLMAQDRALQRFLYEQGEDAFYEGDYRKALSLYNRLDSMNTEDDAFYKFRIGLCYLYSNLDDGGKAIQYIEEAEDELAKSDIADLVYYNLGRAYHVAQQHGKATEAYNTVLELEYRDPGLEREVERQKTMVENAEKFIASPEDVVIRNVGDVVNTQYPDYKPVISADEATLVFTSCNTGSTGGKKDKSGSYYEDIYISGRDQYGNWTTPQKISANINSEYDEASVGMSADGRQLVIYKGRRHGGELYTSMLEGDSWSEPTKLPESINSKGWETSASISSDGQTMYFTSDRKGGMGGLDIYKSEKLQDGTWGPAKNLGPNINTSYDEESPFIHPDNKTLFFSSGGHNSMGGLDVFKCVYEDGVWSAPLNLGYPINSSRNDVHFVLTANGKRGYYTSAKAGGVGEEDIYMIDFQGASVPLILVRGNVYKDGGPPGKVDIKVISRADNTVAKHVYQPDPVTGKYLMILPPGRAYDMIVEAESFKPYLLNIDIPDQKEFREFYQQIQLEAIPPDGERQAERISIVHAFDDYSELGPEYQDLVDAYNKSNRDYLKILMERIMEANEGDSAAVVAENLAAIFDATEPVAESITAMEVEEFDDVAQSLTDPEKLETFKTETSYIYDEENPEKDLLPFIHNGDTLAVVPPGYQPDPALLAEVTGTPTIPAEELIAMDAEGNPIGTGVLDRSGSRPAYLFANLNPDQSYTFKFPSGVELTDDAIAVNLGGTTLSTATKTSSGVYSYRPDMAVVEPSPTPVGLREALKMEIPDVLFEYDRSNVDQTYARKLDDLIAVMKKYPQLNAEVEGHTDSKGSDSYNIALSRRRANAVKQYMRAKGIEPGRISVTGHGESRPKAPNQNPDGSDNPSGRAKNRRTEITLKK